MGRFTKIRNSLTRTGRSINKSTKLIAKNMESINKYEATRKEIATKLKILERDTVNLQSGSLELDVGIMFHRSKQKKANRKIIAKELQSIVDKSLKSAREAEKVMGEDIRTNIAVKELVELRQSDKYVAMADSAAKKGFVKNEADFWYRTVRIANKNLGIDPKTLMTKLNVALKAEKLETMNSTTIAMLLTEVR